MSTDQALLDKLRNRHRPTDTTVVAPHKANGVDPAPPQLPHGDYVSRDEVKAMIDVAIEHTKAEQRAANDKQVAVNGMLLQGITDLRELLNTVLPANKLPFHERLPPFEEITKLHVDLFQNNGKGKPPYDAKFFVTLRGQSSGKNGSICPIHYHLNRADRFIEPANTHELLHDMVKTIGDSPDFLIGCVGIKGKYAKGKGVFKLADQVIIISGDELMLRMPDREMNLTGGTKGEAKKEDSPIMTWNWYAPD